MSIGHVPITGGICAPPGLDTPLLLPELELEPELDPLLELELLPLELPLPPELEPLLLLVGWAPLLLAEPVGVPDDPLLVEPLLEDWPFAPLPEPLLLPVPPLEELGLLAFDVMPVPWLAAGPLFHILVVLEGVEPHSHAAAASTTKSQGGAIQPIFVIVTSSNRAGVPPRRAGY